MNRVLGTLAAAALLLSACSTAAPPAAPAPTQAPAAPTAAPAAQPTTAPAAAPAATSAPAAAAPAASGGTVKIGVLFPLSGSLGLAGKHNLNGAEIALDELNAAGGWQGKKVEFAVGDAPTTAAAVSEANRLISQEGVKVIIGTVSSSLALAAAPVADRNKVILWELEAVSDDLTNKGLQYVFRTVVPASGLGNAAADYTVKSVAPLMNVDPKTLKIGIIHEDGDYGTSVANAVEKTLTDQGIKPVLRESYNAAKETDFSSLILKLKSAGVDVVIPTSYTSDAILFWKQARQLEYAPKALVGTGAGYTVVDFSDALGADVNGVVSSSFPVDIKDSGLSADAQATRKAYLDAFKKKFNYEPSVGEEMAYIGTRMLLRDVLPKVTEMDSDKIREAAMAVDKPLGSEINGWGLKFDKNGQNTRAFGNVIQWQDKQMRSVAPDQLSTSKLASLPLPAWNARGSN